MTEREQAISNLRAAIDEGRLIRKDWHRTENGRELVCLYYALAGNEDTWACPSWLMPTWLAHLTPWIDDAGTDEHWPVVVTKYADLASRWHVLTPEAWTRLDAARAAAWAAAWAAARGATRGATRGARADTIIDSILATIEGEIVAAEGSQA